MPGKFPCEALGGVTLDNIAEIAHARVDYTSADWITIRPPNPDVALQMEIGCRALRLQTLRHRLRRLRIAPLGRIAAVSPGPRSIENMDAELVHFLHFSHPARMNIAGVIVRGLADFRQPKLTVEHFRRNFLGPFPHIGFANDIANSVAGESELAGEMAV